MYTLSNGFRESNSIQALDENIQMIEKTSAQARSHKASLPFVIIFYFFFILTVLLSLDLKVADPKPYLTQNTGRNELRLSY